MIGIGVALAVVTAGVAVAVVLLTRDGSSSLTPAQYLIRADAICRVYARKLDRIPPPDMGSTTAVAQSVARALPVLTEQASAVRALDPPRELEERVRRFFRRTDRSLAALAAVLDAAKRGDAKTMGPRLGAWLAASTEAQTASHEVGYRC